MYHTQGLYIIVQWMSTVPVCLYTSCTLYFGTYTWYLVQGNVTWWGSEMSLLRMRRPRFLAGAPSLYLPPRRKKTFVGELTTQFRAA